MTVNSGVRVDPGLEGMDDGEVQTLMVPGTAYVTDPLRNTVTPVQDIDLYLPGLHRSRGLADQLDRPRGQDDSQRDTNDLQHQSGQRGSSPPQRVRHGAHRPQAEQLGAASVRPYGPLQGAHGDGVAAAVAYPPGHGPADTGRSHLRPGTYTRGHTQVHVSRALPPGPYRLTLTEPLQRVGAGRSTET